MKLHRPTGLLIAVLAIAGLAGRSQAIPAGISILDSERVLSERSRTLSDGLLYLQDEEGALRRFVTSTTDPLVMNPGDGQFHPLPSRRFAACTAARPDPDRRSECPSPSLRAA